MAVRRARRSGTSLGRDAVAWMRPRVHPEADSIGGRGGLPKAGVLREVWLRGGRSGPTADSEVVAGFGTKLLPVSEADRGFGGRSIRDK